MNEKINQSILLQINRLKNLPALPEAGMRILDAINDPDVDIEKLAGILSSSPGLVARLLGLANSSYFGQSRQINDLPTAIFQVLGLDLVKSLSLGIIFHVQFDTRKCRGFDTHYFWMRSLLTAIVAQKLGKELKLARFSPATAYTSGLLLDIGMLVIGFLEPEKLSEILQSCQKNHSAIGEAIHGELGESHFRFGALLLQKWQLSPVCQSVLNHFEDPDFSGDERQLINLLWLCRRLSAALLEADAEAGNFSELEALCESLSLPAAELPRIIQELIENRDNVQQLAAIMSK